MRTTVDIPDALLAEAKRKAADEDVTLSEVVASALRERFLRAPGPEKRRRFRLIEFGEGGLKPGVTFERLKDLSEAEDAERYAGERASRAADSDDDAPPRR